MDYGEFRVEPLNPAVGAVVTGLILRLTQVPPNGGGDTLFSSMYAAYEALSDRMQRILSDLTATHSSRHVYQSKYAIGENLAIGDYFPLVRHGFRATIAGDRPLGPSAS